MENTIGVTDLICGNCGKKTVEMTPSGLYCKSCKEAFKKKERAVHHEGFPHVVSEDEEP